MDTQTSTNTNVFCKHIKNAKPKILCNVLLNLYKRAVSERKGYLYSCVSVIKALNFHFSMGWWWRRRSVEKKSLGIFRVPCEFYLAYFPSRIETLLNILLWKLFQKKNNLTFSSSSSSSFISRFILNELDKATLHWQRNVVKVNQETTLATTWTWVKNNWNNEQSLDRIQDINILWRNQSKSVIITKVWSVGQHACTLGTASKLAGWLAGWRTDCLAPWIGRHRSWLVIKGNREKPTNQTDDDVAVLKTVLKARTSFIASKFSFLHSTPVG